MKKEVRTKYTLTFDELMKKLKIKGKVHTIMVNYLSDTLDITLE